MSTDEQANLINDQYMKKYIDDMRREDEEDEEDEEEDEEEEEEADFEELIQQQGEEDQEEVNADLDAFELENAGHKEASHLPQNGEREMQAENKIPPPPPPRAFEHLVDDSMIPEAPLTAAVEQQDIQKNLKPQKEKRKRRKKKKKDEDDIPTDWEGDIEQKVKVMQNNKCAYELLNNSQQSKLLQCAELPEHIRLKYANIECNPYNLIITNIPPTVTAEELREYFMTLVVSLDPELFSPPPIRNVEIGMTKSFAVVTFNTRAAKHVIKPLREVEFIGCKMAINTPQSFFRKMTSRQIWRDSNAARVSDEEAEEKKPLPPPVQIYMGNLPLYLKDEDVKKLCETFGPLKSFNLVKDNSSGAPVSKGYCFFTYHDQKFAEKAIVGLNGLACGHKKLKVSKANTAPRGQPLPGATDGKGGADGKSNGKNRTPASNAHGSFLAGCELIQIPEVQEMLNVAKFAPVPSRVVQLLNMVTPEDLFEDDLFNELYEDVLEEAKQFGPVEQVYIPRPDMITGVCSPQVGKVFVKFKYLIPAKKARHNLAGRTYNKRTVIASFYPEEKFEQREFLVGL